MKKKKEVKEETKKFYTPIHFDVELRHRDKEVLEAVVQNLIAFGRHAFEWEFSYDEDEKTEIYKLQIHSCWADNLALFASLCKDFTGDLGFPEED